MRIVFFLFFLLGWTVASLGWFVNGLKRKNEPSRWWEYLLFPPVYIIACIIGCFRNK